MLVNLLLVAAGGACGACSRYLITLFAASRWGVSFPFGTFIANIIGCFIIGLFMTLAIDRFDLDPRWRLLVVTGFLGGLTTFSSYSFESMALIESAATLYAFLNIAGNLLLGFTACWLGIVCGRII